MPVHGGVAKGAGQYLIFDVWFGQSGILGQGSQPTTPSLDYSVAM
ncbi:hypothetical protein EDC40_101351 [Aminobacter aminovorans]|uniref:Uncharacterized protein n=1 Tax=Aminobacter aminovorans TaxID=83263 RepID=A0A380WPL7_AMIAI|nr:hypothetical protein EDC40_101351 [Aminobacter aminovorans]SUU90883.1 Uncharacterised protein [Aminobacter aminovorans]